jgi:hypothetical protein
MISAAQGTNLGTNLYVAAFMLGLKQASLACHFSLRDTEIPSFTQMTAP